MAREILELHPLRIDGGYTQSDVIVFAKAFTGWSHRGMVPPGRTVPVSSSFVFRNVMHESGPKTILGKTDREDGSNEATAVMH